MSHNIKRNVCIKKICVGNVCPLYKGGMGFPAGNDISVFISLCFILTYGVPIAKGIKWDGCLSDGEPGFKLADSQLKYPL